MVTPCSCATSAAAAESSTAVASASPSWALVDVAHAAQDVLADGVVLYVVALVDGYGLRERRRGGGEHHGQHGRQQHYFPHPYLLHRFTIT
jgi:hypothetical protein